MTEQPRDPMFMPLQGLQRLIDRLRDEHYLVIGPMVSDGAIVYDEIQSIEQLPAGWFDHQDAGHYRLLKGDEGALFAHVVGPHSWKRYLHPPRLRLWRAVRTDNEVRIQDKDSESPRYAFLGVRACEIKAMGIQDRVFASGPKPDQGYADRRENALVIAVNCTRAGGTCFCVSMQSGPAVTEGHDLALTELIEGDEHGFLVEAGSERGLELLDALDLEPAGAVSIARARAAVAGAASQMGRTLDTANVKQLLQSNLEHPRWDEVADRCLSCTNCTMVCPTCFCTTVEDVNVLTAEPHRPLAERWRRWDSCFSLDFSYIHGGNVRSTPKARYRQWLTHKLAHWIDQFGESGCVGCGRCITWCPVGIDITEEVAAIRAGQEQQP
ncbi:MAG: 4Fe-4S dicluster domain-containing protein [Gammaproteobacteria bacterium]|nr:4Fe-4S dicluster domain-containing protein [Gammaproteobacteria bacterium]